MIQTPEREQARQILAANAGLHVRIIAADPSMWGKTGSALPPAAQMATEGLHLTKADNDRLGGKARMHTYLAEGPACAHHRELGWTTCPMMHVLDGSCPMFVKTMGSLPRDPHRPEDVDTDGPDHWYDAGRYLEMSIGGGPSFPLLDEPEQERSQELALPYAGKFAVRPDPNKDAFPSWGDDDDPNDMRGKVAKSPWAS